MQSSIACGSCWWWNYLGRTGHRRALYCFSSELLNRSPKGWQNLSLIFVSCQPYFCFENSLLHEPWQSERFLGIASVFVRWNFAWLENPSSLRCPLVAHLSESGFVVCVKHYKWIWLKVLWFPANVSMFAIHHDCFARWNWQWTLFASIHRA